MTTKAPVVRVVQEPIPATSEPMKPIVLPKREPVLVPVRRKL